MDETISMISFGDTLLEDNLLTHTSDGILKYLQETDIITFNLETVVSDLDGCKRDKAFTFKTPSVNLDRFLTMTDSEIVCNVANNHIMDYGEVGLNDTLKNLRSRNIEFTGYSYDLDLKQGISFISKKGKRFAFIGAYNGFSVNESKPGLTPINGSLIEKVKFAKTNSDYVILHLHWGEELSLSPTPKQKALSKTLVNAGADLIFGHHPHVIQATEFFKCSFIAYSIGNFQIMTYENNRNSSYGQMIHVEFNKTISVKIIPIYIKNRCPEIITDSHSVNYKEYNDIVRLGNFYNRYNSWALFFLHSSKYFIVDSYSAWRKRFQQNEKNVVAKMIRWHFNKKTIVMLFFGIVSSLFTKPLHWLILKSKKGI